MIPPQVSSRRTVFAPHLASSGFIGLNRITTVALNTHGFLSSPRMAPSHIHPLCSIRTGTLLIPTILFPCSSDAGAICPWVLSELAVIRFSSFLSVIPSHPRYSDTTRETLDTLNGERTSLAWLLCADLTLLSCSTRSEEHIYLRCGRAVHSRKARTPRNFFFSFRYRALECDIRLGLTRRPGGVGYGWMDGVRLQLKPSAH
jgi:hypothetical protein